MITKTSNRVCSHMEPPPPDGNGPLYGLCPYCSVFPVTLPKPQRRATGLGPIRNETLLKIHFGSNGNNKPIRQPRLFRLAMKEVVRMRRAKASQHRELLFGSLVLRFGENDRFVKRNKHEAAIKAHRHMTENCMNGFSVVMPHTPRIRMGPEMVKFG